MDDIAATVEAVLLPHPAIRAVELVGSRAGGSPTPLSDWDFVVVTDRFDEVARALPGLVARARAARAAVGPDQRVLPVTC